MHLADELLAKAKECGAVVLGVSVDAAPEALLKSMSAVAALFEQARKMLGRPLSVLDVGLVPLDLTTRLAGAVDGLFGPSVHVVARPHDLLAGCCSLVAPIVHVKGVAHQRGSPISFDRKRTPSFSSDEPDAVPSLSYYIDDCGADATQALPRPVVPLHSGGDSLFNVAVLGINGHVKLRAALPDMRHGAWLKIPLRPESVAPSALRFVA